MQGKCVIKYTHDDGTQLDKPVTWCGNEHLGGFVFQDAQHVALAAGGSVQPCKACVRAIIEQLQQELGRLGDS